MSPVSVESDLGRATAGWTLPVVVRDYKNDAIGRDLLQREGVALGLHGYVPASQSADAGHLNLGRTLLGGAVFGGNRTGGHIVVTYNRDEQRAVAAASAVDERNRGIVSRLTLNANIIGTGVEIGGVGVAVVGLLQANLAARGSVRNNGAEPWDAVEVEASLFRTSDLVPGPVGITMVMCPRPGMQHPWKVAFPKTPRGVSYSVGAVVRNLLRAGQWLPLDQVSSGDHRHAEVAAALGLAGPIESDAAGRVLKASAQLEERASKVCPDCAETVLAAANICRFCRHEFSIT